uniref:hypothetical protein n=1 Tax=Lentzea alba TaxID=2714351 RepID=UPI0039BF0D3C
MHRWKTKGRKRHIATDPLGLLLAVVVTAAHIKTATAPTGCWRRCVPGSPPYPISG